MVTKSSAFNAQPQALGVDDSATQQIWLAGLGAWAKAQEQGTKVFETLVQEGLANQRQTQLALEQQLAQTAHQISDIATVASVATQATPAAPSWDPLASIFDGRVAKTLERLGHPTEADWNALRSQVAQLEKQLRLLQKTTATPRSESNPTSRAKPTAGAKAKTAKPR